MPNETEGRLLTADIVCYGVPSPGAFQAYLGMLEKGRGVPIVGYHHRGHGIQAGGDEVAAFADGSTRCGTAATMAWRRTWYGALVRESCYRCGWHSVRRPGDVTMGDFWGIEGVAPELADRWGVSLLMASTPAGLELARGASEELALFRSTVGEAANPAQPMLSRPPARGERAPFWNALCAGGFEGACRAVGVTGHSRQIGDFLRRAAKSVRGGKFMSKRKQSGGAGLREADFASAAERGEYPVVFAAKNRDDEVRRESSSGGVFHALASHVIGDLGGVVYGCAFNEGLRAVHVRCETMAEAERCMGSKYSQSDMRRAIPDVRADLGAGRTVLFTGTPCQVAAVRAACADVAGGGLLVTADIICHGVPSSAAFQEWLRTLEGKRGSAVERYEHRPKSMGWGHFERVTFADGRSEQGTRWSEAWKRYFYDNRSLRPSCYRCPYTTVAGRPGDVTIADFWGIEGTGLSPLCDSLGVSLVLANSERGLRMLAALDADFASADVADALPGNPMLVRPSTYGGRRPEVWEGVYRDGMLATMRRERFLASPARAAASRAKRAVKRILGRG